MNSKFSIWKDHITGEYEVVRNDPRPVVVVQTNLKTRQKAEEARRTWEEREATKNGG
jgi:hypothetical protein